MALLELQGVTKAYDQLKVVDGFDLKVHRGELRCLLGPNGAGKTTTIDLITGRQQLTGGVIALDGTVISDWPEHLRVRAGLARKFQVPAVFKGLTVRQNLEAAFTRHLSPIRNMFVYRDAETRTRIEEVAQLVNLSGRLRVRAEELSHGETQWLEIGMVLTQNARILLMDEPTAGMTTQETHKTGEIFNELKGTHTLLVVEHDMEFVRQIADRVTVMHMGRFLAEGTIREIEQNEDVKRVYLGQGGLGHA
ncbi:MAG: ATP-binding cassette domain-containing protein [Betaproteobacteria bacterium]|nr:ATP-binding cassette domain-containing protein [Betaproteobacteria bacterium]